MIVAQVLQLLHVVWRVSEMWRSAMSADWLGARFLRPESSSLRTRRVFEIVPQVIEGKPLQHPPTVDSYDSQLRRVWSCSGSVSWGT